MRLLRPSEVARFLAVDPKTVSRWAASGRIGCVTTPGGHRRFHPDDLREFLENNRHVTASLEDLGQ